ncbi:trichohyalin isoform X6 [Patella vulgata]|uniref:trichohyalin isoform X6 n=2 Tax=Patella vulgata TaxID=6465 RepID=UPI0024A9420D|nr:trichohyalin isoform X6 [Patella vulgata]
MSSALVDTDIDRFIREQKSKLASEKHDLNEDDNYFKTSRRQWAEPDKENFIIAGSNERDERAETPAHQGYPVDNRQIIKQRKELSDQRKQEYNNYLKTHTDNRRKPKNLTPTQKSIQVGEYDNKIKERLHGQRKKEYNDYLNKAQKKGKTKRGRNFKYHNHNAVLTDRFDQHDYDAVARQHQDENYHDYDLHLQLGSPVEYYETNDVYPDNDTSRVAGLPVGQYEENKKRNAEETKRKYRADLEKQLREKEKIIKRQHGVKSKKISRDEREKQLRIREEMLRKQLRVQGSPRRSIEKRDRKLYQPVQPQRCTCGYNFPRADAEERAYLDFIHLRDKYDFRYQDEYDEWQRRQLAALSEIERRQLELRLKLERDLALHYLQRDAMAHLSDEEKEAIRHCPVHIAKCSPCASRSPSPHIDPPLYDPTEAEILRQSSETPERLLIGETSTEHREKLRQERQREYNDMMAQNQGAERRQWEEPTSIKPAEDKSKKNLGNSGGYFPVDNSHIHRQKMAEERKQEYQEMLQTSQKINRQPLHKRNQPEQKPNPQIQVQNPSAQTNGVQNQESKPADQSYTPSSPTKEARPVQETNGYASPTKESQPAPNSNGVSSQSKPASQNGNQKGQGKDPRRRVWKEDSQLDFFSSNRYEVRKQPTDKFQAALNTDVGSHGQQPEKNGYVPSAAEKARTQDYNERREEYNNMLKNQSRPNQRRYYEPENDEFMKRREERTPRQAPNQLESFIKTGPAPSGKENHQVDNQLHANTNNSNISAAEEQRNDYNNMIKNSSKTPRRVYKEPSSDDFFDFGRIQKKNPEEKRPRERAPVDEERRQEYNNTIKSKPAPRARPFRENSSDDFLKYGGPQRRVNHNGLRVSQSETFQNQEKNYQEKIKGGGQTPRRRMWREPSKDDFFIGSTKYQVTPKKRNNDSFLL